MQIRSILKEIGNPNLNLYRAKEGYHYFVFEKEEKYETRSVYVYRLGHLSFDLWVTEGRDFLKEIGE